MYLAGEYDLSSDFMETAYLTGRVHSVFKRVINLEFTMPFFMMPPDLRPEHRIITLLLPGSPSVPDSLIAAPALFSLIKKYGDYVIIKKENLFLIEATGETIYLSDAGNRRMDFQNARLMFDPGRMQKVTGRLRRFLACTDRKDGFTLLSVVYQEYLDSFIRALLIGCGTELASAFRRLVGAGIGLTPSCDDAMVGAMACLCGYYAAAGKGGVQDLTELTHSLLPALEHEKLTTDISGKYLKCACRGQFSKILVDLVLQCYCMEKEGYGGIEDIGRIEDTAGVENIRRIKAIEEILARLAAVGHTSGLDMLHGFEAALEAILNRQESIGKRRQQDV